MKQLLFLSLFIICLKFSFSQTIFGIDVSELEELNLKVDTTFALTKSQYAIQKPKLIPINIKPNYIQYNTEKGFPDPFCYETVQDNNKELWIGLDREGVCSFNGNRFKVYNKANGLSSNHVKLLDCDSTNRIWLGTYKDVNIIENNRVKKLHRSQPIINERVYSMVFLDSNSAIISYQESGLYELKLKKDSLIYSKLYSPERFVDNLEIYDGLIYFSIQNEVFKIKKFKSVGQPELVFSFQNDVTKIGFYKNDLIVSTNQNIFKKIENQFVPLLKESAIINDFVVDQDNQHLFIGTYYQGLLLIDLNENISKKINLEIYNGLIYSLFIDSDKNIWISTGGEGFIKLRKTDFDHVDLNSEFTSFHINHNIIYGATDKGYISIEEDTMYSYDQIIPGKQTLCWSISEDKYKRMWFGTYGTGVFYKESNHYYYLNSLNQYLNDRAGAVLCVNNSVYVGSYEGLAIIKNDSISIINKKSGLPESQVSCFQQSGNSEILIGLENNLIVYRNGKYFNLTEQLKIKGTIDHMYDDDDFLFILGDEGVTLFDKKTNETKYINTSVGLSNNFSNSIVKLRTNEYLVGTNNGINYIDLADGMTIKTIGYHDGFTGVATNAGGGIKFKEKIYWGTVKGLVIQNLKKEVDEGRIKPSLIIEEVLFDYKNQNNLTSISTDFETKYITIKYYSVDLNNYNKVEYSFRIEGYDNRWSSYSNSEEVTLSNLPQDKDLVFELKSKNSSGVESDIVRVNIFIEPPFWKKTWFYIIIVFIILFLSYLIYKNKTRQLIKKQLQLEHKIEEATSEIRAKKEIIEEVHKEITDSINYAERIQRSFLATSDLLDKHLDNYFVYFNPKEAVSGDFYWAGELVDGNFAISCADSTGHGVPGAIMSILNISSIEKAVENGATTASDIFNEARITIIERLKKDGSAEGGKDGMDASLLILNPEKTKLAYVAANNPIWIVREGELIDIKGEKMPVGKHDNDHVPFEGGQFELQKGDIIYALTDGFQDQFGGEKGKKFKVKPMKRMLLDIASLPMKEQENKIAEVFDGWKKDLEQVDDVCLIGVRV